MIAAASYSLAPPLISISANGGLHEFYQSPGQVGGVDEGDPGAPPAASGLFVDKPCPRGAQVGESSFDVDHRVREVVEPLAALLEKPTDRGDRLSWLEQLDKASSYRQKGLFDTLAFDQFAMNRLHAVAQAITLD